MFSEFLPYFLLFDYQQFCLKCMCPAPLPRTTEDYREYTKIKDVALTCINPLALMHSPIIVLSVMLFTVVGWTLFFNGAPGHRTGK